MQNALVVATKGVQMHIAHILHTSGMGAKACSCLAPILHSAHMLPSCMHICSMCAMLIHTCKSNKYTTTAEMLTSFGFIHSGGVDISGRSTEN